MSALFWLSDDAWAAIEPYLPTNQSGARRVDDRRVISGILHVLKTGCRWKDCPAGYGPPTTIYNRFNRWSRRRLWTDRPLSRRSDHQDPRCDRSSWPPGCANLTPTHRMARPAPYRPSEMT